jgi:hypothetical protein
VGCSGSLEVDFDDVDEYEVLSVEYVGVDDADDVDVDDIVD